MASAKPPSPTESAQKRAKTGDDKAMGAANGEPSPGKKKPRKATPLMGQYDAIKRTHPDALLLFRVGDFYETFGADAIRAAKILGIVLTKRANGAASHIELAGFPYHSLDTYLPRLVKAGIRVAICEQLEDPKLTKGLVKRGVTELITPGLATGDKILDQSRDNYLAAVAWEPDGIGLALLDLSTGRFLISSGDEAHLDRLLDSYQPAEVLLPRSRMRSFSQARGERWYAYPQEDWIFRADFGRDQLTAHFGTQGLKGFGLDGQRAGDAALTAAAGAILHYLGQTEHRKLAHITSLQRLAPESHVWLDRFTVRNLELLQANHPDGRSLLDVLSRCASPMGARLLRRWLSMPLVDPERINTRLDAVEALVKDTGLRRSLVETLNGLGDLERLLAKVAMGKASPRDIGTLRNALQALPALGEDLGCSGEASLLASAEGLDPCGDLLAKLEAGLVDDPPAQLGKSPAIREGVDPELDEWRALRRNGKQYLKDLQDRESARTGIASLKVGFNNVFGYYLEVTNKYRDQAPPEWIRKQTLVNAERYITEELKTYEEKILGAESRIDEREAERFAALVTTVQHDLTRLQQNAAILARLDVLACFAQNAIDFGYRRPVLQDEPGIAYKAGRHPVIERLLPPGESYVPNDLTLDQVSEQLLIITGPNMSGKSALLRQTALITLLAQSGSFVPAEQAHIGWVDKLFTRVGASDNISGGESTFMVEMLETASIVNNLSARSLVILDEIGRGTSTYDGISMAWSLAEFLHNHDALRPLTLFATHYHELSDLAESLPRVRNYHVATREHDGQVIFLRTLSPGGSQHSFGIHVARMAGMHPDIVERASSILASLEAQKGSKGYDQQHADTGFSAVAEPGDAMQATEDHSNFKQPKVSSLGTVPAAPATDAAGYQLNIFEVGDPALGKVRDRLASLDPNRLTPVEALLCLQELQGLLGIGDDSEAPE